MTWSVTRGRQLVQDEPPLIAHAIRRDETVRILPQTGPGSCLHYCCVGALPSGEFKLGLLLRMLVCRLAVTVRILTMRLSRAGMHFCLVVFALFVVLGRFAVLMCCHFVL